MLYRVQHEATTASQQDFLLHELYCNQTYNSQTITDKVNQMEYYLNNSKDRHKAMTMPHMDLWFRQAKNDCSTFKIWPDLTGGLWWEWPHKRETSCHLTVTWWMPVVEQEMITFPEHMNSSTFLVGFAAQSFVFWIVFYQSLFVFLTF